MSFENVDILVTIGATPAETQWSQAGTVGSVVTFALSDNTGVNTRHWALVGRPEGSGAGGGGPEPLDLGTAATASITLDLKGTYVVWCLVNGGSPNATTLRSGVAYLEAITDPDGLPLRLLGPNETDEDIHEPLVEQGWIKMLNRWLKLVRVGGGGGVDAHDVRARSGDAAPAFLDTKLEAGTGISFANVTTGGVQKLRINSTVTPGTDLHDVKATSADAAPAFLDTKLYPGTNITLTPVTVGGVDKIQIDAAGGGGVDAHDVKAGSTDAAPAFLDTKLDAGTNITLTPVTVGGIDKIRIAASGGAGPADVADWDLTKVRYFFLDGDAGDDGNDGYIDDVAGTDFTARGAEVADAAIKTTSRLESIIPRVGAGRKWVVLAKPRAGNAKYDHVGTDGLGRHDRSKLTGYSLMHFRGSDLTNSATDRLQLGFVTALGPYVVATSSSDAVGVHLTLTGATLPAGWELLKYRVRAVQTAPHGGHTSYGVVRWGDLADTPDATKLTVWGFIFTIAAGDSVYLELPGTALDTFREAASAAFGGTASHRASLAGVRFSGGAVYLGFSDDAQSAHYTQIVSDSSPALPFTESGSGFAGGIVSDSTYVSETGGDPGNSRGMGIVGKSLNIVGAKSVNLQYCAFASDGSGAGTACAITADKIGIANSTFQTLTLSGAPNSITLNTVDYGQLTLAPYSTATATVMRGIPGWTPVITILPTSPARCDVGASLQFTDVAALWGAEPATPGFVMYEGAYTVLLDFGTDGSANIVAGSGIKVWYSASEFIIASYASLQVTGFEIEGHQKIICKLAGLLFPDDTLFCPRCKPMRPDSTGSAIGTGIVLRGWGLDSPGFDSWVTPLEDSTKAPVGVSVCDCDMVASTRILVAEEGFVMLQRGVGEGPTPWPKPGDRLYLWSADGTVANSGGIGSLIVPPGYLQVGTMLPIGPDVFYDTAHGSSYLYFPAVLVMQYQATPTTLTRILSSNFSKTSDTARAAVPELTAILKGLDRVLNPVTYEFEAVLFVAGHASGGYQACILGASSFIASISFTEIASGAPVMNYATIKTAIDDPLTLAGPASGIVTIKGTIGPASVDFLALGFAQAASNPVPSVVLAGSFLKVTRQTSNLEAVIQ